MKTYTAQDIRAIAVTNAAGDDYVDLRPYVDNVVIDNDDPGVPANVARWKNRNTIPGQSTVTITVAGSFDSADFKLALGDHQDPRTVTWANLVETDIVDAADLAPNGSGLNPTNRGARYLYIVIANNEINVSGTKGLVEKGHVRLRRTAGDRDFNNTLTFEVSHAEWKTEAYTKS